MICRKCKSPGNVIIRKEYCYCEDCFNININHKFRACMGKNKKISANDKVLICLSGEINSTVLLDLIHNGISLTNHKKLRLIPYFLHVIETDDNEIVTKSITEQCSNYGFNIELVNINEYTKNKLDNTNDANLYCSRYSNNIPSTIKYDIKKKLKRSIFLNIAKKMQCKMIFTAETTTTLAARLLSNLAIGRGSQVENDAGFADSRDDNVKILRPMKDISIEEIEHYIKINHLNSVPRKSEEKSLQSVISSFVLDLQENYPATVSTICKTAEKLGSQNGVNKKQVKKCVICQSAININYSSLNAVDATIFSKKVSFCKNQEVNTDNVSSSDENNMFPFMNDTLCYCCSRNYFESRNCK